MAITTAANVVLLALLCVVPGAPVALLLARRRERSLASLVVQGLFLGMGIALVVGLLAAHTVGVSRVSVGFALGVVSVAAWAAAAPRLDALPRPRATVPGVATAALLVVALALRLDPVYFLAQSADFGEYVNRGNVIADGGALGEWFLHLYSVAIALSHLALGEASAMDVMPFLGMALVVGLLAVAHELGFGPVVRLLAAAVLALHVVPVWFALLPTSEALYAALLVGMVLFLLLAVHRGHHLEAAVAGGAVGLEMLTRGNALLLLPALALGVVIGAALVERRHARVAVTFLVVATFVTYAGFVYNARYSYDYFVPYQLGMYLDETLGNGVTQAVGSLRSPGRALLGLVPTALLAGLVVAAVGAANRLGSGDGRWSVPVRRAALPAASLVLLAGAAVFGPGPVTHALRNYGLPLGAVALAGVVVVLVRSGRVRAPANVVLAPVVVVGAAFVFLHGYRLRWSRGAPTFLYWDRYLFSEVFPVVVIVTFFGLAAVVAAHDHLARRLGDRRWVATAVAGVVGAVALGSIGSSTGLLREQRFFDGYYEALAEVDELAGSGDGPIVYVGVDELPAYSFHPNTHRLVGLPLAQTFDRTVLNVALPPFAPDDVPSWDEIVRTLRDTGHDRGFVVSATPTGGAVTEAGNAAPPTGVRTRVVGVVELRLPVLDEPMDTSQRSWHSFDLDLAVIEVSLGDAPAAGV